MTCAGISRPVTELFALQGEHDGPAATLPRDPRAGNARFPRLPITNLGHE
jgi:hypothetical protein